MFIGSLHLIDGLFNSVMLCSSSDQTADSRTMRKAVPDHGYSESQAHFDTYNNADNVPAVVSRLNVMYKV